MRIGTTFANSPNASLERCFRAIGGCGPLGFRAGDANLYRYVGNDPVNGVDPSGLAGEAAVLTGSAVAAKYRDANKYNPLANQPAIYGALSSKEQTRIDRRLAPHAIQLAALKGIAEAGVAGVKPGLGDDLKATITADDFGVIKTALGNKLSSKKTISGDKAWGVNLRDNWELKIYLKGDVYSVSVGHQSDSIEHYLDAVAYKLKGSSISSSTGGGFATISTYPNGKNAEVYLGKAVYDYETAYELKRFADQGHISEDQYNSIIKNGVFVGHPNLRYEFAGAVRQYREHCKELGIPGN